MLVRSVHQVSDVQAMPERVYWAMTDCKTKLYCLFLQTTIPEFNSMNLLLQRDELMIHVISSKYTGLLTNLIVRFMKPEAIRGTNSTHTLDLSNRDLQKSRDLLNIGQKARSYLTECKDNGMMSGKDRTDFYDTVRRYYATATTYIAKKFPLGDPLQQNATVADINNRDCAKFSDLQYFTDRFPSLLQDDATLDQLEMQFLRYQVDHSPNDSSQCRSYGCGLASVGPGKRN